jgi:hypothetical protein
LWQPPATDVAVEFYDVVGSSQTELEDAMVAAHICDHYGSGCLPDPGNPSTGALALEGENVPDGQVCYSARSFVLHFDYYIVLPRWRPLAVGGASVNTVTAWNALLGVMWTHEMRHVAIAEADIAQLNAQAQTLLSCSAVYAFWEDAHVFDQLNADQNAYHAQLRADCQPSLGCIPYGWLGW